VNISELSLDYPSEPDLIHMGRGGRNTGVSVPHLPHPNFINHTATNSTLMKYTARHIQRFLETGRIDATLWKNHFPTLLPTQVPTCDDCGELKERTCAGGRDPVECFLAKAPAAEPGGEHRQKKRDPMLGLGAQGLKVRKTPKPKDQSKM